MKKYLFDTDDFVLISYLKSETPKKIWWTPIQYVFDYEGFYIELETYSCGNNSFFSNDYDLILSVRLRKVNEKYTNIKGCLLLSENRKITNIYIVRTLIYFYDYRNQKYLKNINYNYCGNFLIHPNDKLEKDVNPKSSNLVDVGLLINIENDFIDAFVKDNNDDFFKFEENYLLKNFDLKDLPKIYEYIIFK